MHTTQDPADGRAALPQAGCFTSRNTVFAALLGAGIVGLAWFLLGSLSPAVHRQVFSESGGEIRVSYTHITANGTESGQIRNVRAIEYQPGCVVVHDKNGAGTVFFPQHTRELSWANYGGN
jgi:hypothetical protein